MYVILKLQSTFKTDVFHQLPLQWDYEQRFQVSTIPLVRLSLRRYLKVVLFYGYILICVYNIHTYVRMCTYINAYE